MRRTKLRLPDQRKPSWFQTTALPIVVCLILSGCVVSTMRHSTEAPATPSASIVSPVLIASAALPPRFLRPDGQEMYEEAFQGLFKNYDYIILDGDPQSPGQRELQATLLASARAALREGEQQGLTHQSLPLREPALVLESLSVEDNLALKEQEGQPSQDGATRQGLSRETQALNAYRALLDVAEQDTPLPLRGLSLPERVARDAAISVASVAQTDRHFLPPLILPMPEDQERLDTNTPVTMLVPASGSSETVVLRDPGPGSTDTAALNLRNSAMAWHATQLAHEDVERPLFIVLKRAAFDRGQGLAEAISYFDDSARVLQIVVAEGNPTSAKAEDGRTHKALIPATPLPPVGRPELSKADYIFALVEPDSK